MTTELSIPEEQLIESLPTPENSLDSGIGQTRLSTQLTFFLFIILIINTAVAVAIAGYHFNKEYSSLMQSRAETVGSNLQTFMNDILSFGLPIGSLEGIDKELEKVVQGDLQAVYANVINEQGEIIYSVPEPINREPFYPEQLIPLLKKNDLQTLLIQGVYNTFIPLEDKTNNKVVGGINIGISRRDVMKKTMDSLKTLILIFTIFILFTIFLLFLLTKRTIFPLEILNKSALALAKGNYSVQVDITSKNEIGSLGESFNFMAQQMELNHKTMHDYTEELEQRNTKLQKAQEEILQREKKLKDTQTQLVLSEKMASLGVLISGIAHEINTPAGAVANVATDLRSKIRVMIEGLLSIETLTREDQLLFGNFAEEFAKEKFVTDSGTQWKKTRELRQWLTEAGVEKSKDVASILIKHNLVNTDVLKNYISLLNKIWVMNFLDSLGTVNLGMQICESSIKKISEIVKALKYYAYTDMDKTTLVDLNENIENALVLLHNKLKYSIDLKKDLRPIPKILCTNEISQVWTNLISNAHDAAIEANPEGKGKIRIETEENPDWVLVKIIDSGVGISDENINKMFDPFFTTKEVGKGTGLGLSIVSGIINKHKGKIKVDSEPGKTTFTVYLPKVTKTGEELDE